MILSSAALPVRAYESSCLPILPLLPPWNQSNAKNSTLRQGLCSFTVSLSLALLREREKALIHFTTRVGRESIHTILSPMHPSILSETRQTGVIPLNFLVNQTLNVFLALLRGSRNWWFTATWSYWARSLSATQGSRIWSSTQVILQWMRSKMRIRLLCLVFLSWGEPKHRWQGGQTLRR